MKFRLLKFVKNFLFAFARSFLRRIRKITISVHSLFIIRGVFAVGRKIFSRLANYIKKLYKTFYLVVVRLHKKLQHYSNSFADKNTYYKRYLTYIKKHRRSHRASQVATLMLIVMIGLRLTVSASDVNKVWNFLNPSDFLLSDDTSLEYSGSSVRLKAQNYSKDASTAALFHLDENAGSTVSDDSDNGNTGQTSGSPSWGTGNLNNGLILNGTSQNVTVQDSASLSLTSSHSLEAWTKLNSNFSAGSTTSRQTIMDKGSYQLYYDNETGKATYEIENSNATKWSLEAGDGRNNSWQNNAPNYTDVSFVHQNKLYVGTELGEVWMYDKTKWTKIGGNTINASWSVNEYGIVLSMASDGTNLYVGMGSSNSDGDVWKWNGTSWTKIGGDGLNSGWTIGSYEQVKSLDYFSGTLYAGLGNSAGDGEVWKWNGTSWTKIGGDGLNASWSTAYQVSSLVNDGTNLYAGTGTIAGQGDLWKYNGSTWTQIGGDGLNSSWATATQTFAFSQGNDLFAAISTGTAGSAEVWQWTNSTWTRLAYSGSPFPAASYEYIYDITGDGNNIYIGTGNTSSDGDVWKYNGSTWTQIGGDGLNSGWSGTAYTFTNSMAWFDSKLYVDIYSSTVSYYWAFDAGAWSRVAGSTVNGTWGVNRSGRVDKMITSGDKMYAGLSNTSGLGVVVYEYDGTSWRIIGHPGIANWSSEYRYVTSMTSMNGDLYVGMSGSPAGAGDVWKYNGSTWTQIGGDGLNSGWAELATTSVPQLAANNGVLYASIRVSFRNYIYKFQSGTWTLIGDIGYGSYSSFDAMQIYNNDLYISFSNSAVNSNDVWKYNGSTWTQIGGDGLKSGWSGDVSNATVQLSIYKGKMLAATRSGSPAELRIWQWDGTVWSLFAQPSDLDDGYSSASYSSATSMAVYNGKLYVGFYPINSGDGADVWEFNGSAWSLIGGRSVNDGWTTAIEEVASMQVYKGKLYVGLGVTNQIDALVYSYGNNGYLQSITNSFDTSWRHLAATYNGATMKLYINGVLDSSASVARQIPDTNSPLWLGRGQGSTGRAVSDGAFNGRIDEVRISNTARSSFTTKPYNSERVAVRLAAADYKSGIEKWDTINSSESLDGGTITYRLSSDGGNTWRYWNSTSWVASSGLDQSNPMADISTNIKDFPVTSGGITWQAVLDSDGNQRVQLNSVTLEATSDTTPPAANASNVIMKNSPSGSSINAGEWVNDSNPYFTWTPANDSQSPIKGYCLYLGTDTEADPESTKGSFLGTSPIAASDICPYMVSSTELDTATSGVLSSALSSSNSNYYLKIKAVDNAGNIFAGSSASFEFLFDNTLPENPLFITTPAQYVSNKQVTITWPSADNNAARDSHSGIAGLQYRIGSNGTWYGDGHTGSQDSGDLLVNDGSYQTIDPEDFSKLIDGSNTIYFRTFDVAGNVSSSYVSAVIKINTVSPTMPLNITATPSTNTVNSFAFSWDPPADLTVPAESLRYCYTINTLPSSNTCNYTDQNVTSVPAGAYATQPGENTFYVVAKDESGNINYVTYGQTTFTANTAAPGIPRNIDTADISVRSTSNWRLTLSWDTPSDSGAGIATYKIYRSTDNVTFAPVASTAGTSYVDTGLQQIKYYYKVKACDSANNCGAYTEVVDNIPTGKYTTPADLISDPKSTEISTRRAAILWTTNRDSDSRIQYGLSSGDYFSTEAAVSKQTTDHSVSLNNLTAGTTYYFRARWTDIDGNIGTSKEYSFTTSPAPVVKEASADTTLDSAIVRFTSKDAAKVKIYYGRSEGFGGVKQLNTSLTESKYTVQLTDLEDGTKYFYKINTLDSDNNEYEGNVYAFSTPPRPRISNVRFQPVADQPSSTQRVTWETNVPSTSELNYGIGNLNKIVSNPKVTTQHEIIISGLLDDSTYQLVAKSRDDSGNLAQSDVQIFKTQLDTRPPKVFDVQAESTIRGNGAEARGQIVVTWKTDEPATSQLAYGEGSTGPLSITTREDAKLTTDHVMVISDLSTSRVYHVEPRSYDKARNLSTGERKITIIGRASENVLSIIFNALRNIFGIDS